MSFTSLNSVPPIDAAAEPAAVRNGNRAAKQAYQAGLAFEQMLVDQLAQEMSATVGGSSDGTDSSGGGTGLLGSTDPATSTFAQMLPDALGTGVMSAGGLGVAAQIATSMDPALQGKL